MEAAERFAAEATSFQEWPLRCWLAENAIDRLAADASPGALPENE